MRKLACLYTRMHTHTQTHTRSPTSIPLLPLSPLISSRPRLRLRSASAAAHSRLLPLRLLLPCLLGGHDGLHGQAGREAGAVQQRHLGKRASRAAVRSQRRQRDLRGGAALGVMTWRQ